ncbi:FAD-dependent oxidoreductase [Algimonas porphyrae]|uniref:Glutamate synthase n=1 Tax=Algimonas porphyrae TaxID=1128113 RepID=A0ABQ5UVC1_9PROT|nr:NAD(P)/FAD-dependent oxidoreductase [Algimonas porphyrae]GLQ19219.1 glutamate synthase [Algimonas porphyrae]
MMGASSIGIAGCGIGGLAVACALAKQGHSITLFDKFDTPRPVGSGLVIQPVGQTCLGRIGVLKAALERGRAIYQLRGHESRTGRTVLRANYGAWGGAAFGLAIHRADLFECLYDKATRSGLTIVPSTEITATVLEKDKRILCDQHGQSYGPFDLVIDASGAKSALSPIRTQALPYGALWGTVEWPGDTLLRPDCLTQCYRGAHHMLGVLPLHDDGRTAIFWSEPTDRLEAWFSGDLDAWKTAATKLWPDFAPFIMQIEAHEAMTVARYRHGTLAQPWGERIAYIGDAAHQASPQLGQGANMALLDAAALADAIRNGPIALAPQAYARKRRLHMQFYQAVSRVFTPFYQSANPTFPWVRNNLMHPVSQIWPANRMLTTLISGDLVPTGV